MLKNKIKIDKKTISGNDSTFIVAELSANHNQNFDLAVKTIKAAKEAGADAIKLQTYTADTMTIDSDNKYFQINQGTVWDGTTLYSLYKKAYTPWEWQPKLKKIANKLGLIFFSSPFDKTAVDFLDKMHVPAYKIASFEINDIPLIEYAASKGKPMIISTGVATLAEIKEAIDACVRMNNEEVILLKCTSAYPSPYDEINLKTIPNMKETFNAIVGLSDHTLGISMPIASVALGAQVIEKHFILDKKIKSLDSTFSIDPKEFKSMVQSVREVEKALGEVNYSLTKTTKKNRDFKRSLFIVEDIKKGEKFTEKNVRSIRPNFGLEPKYISNIIGKTASKDLKKGTPLSWAII